MTKQFSAKKNVRVPEIQRLTLEARLLLREAIGTWNRRRVVLASSTLILLLAVILCMTPHDAALLKGVQLRGVLHGDRLVQLKHLARDIGFWGDFAGYDLALVLTLWLGSRMFRSRFLRRLSVACMMGAVLAGAAANVLRVTVGRPRPEVIERTGGRDQISGPRLDSSHHSFPSAHTATAFGCTIPLAVAVPPVGVPLLAAPVAVAWSRMFGGHHNPSDVLVATWIAVIFGVPLGLAARRIGGAPLQRACDDRNKDAAPPGNRSGDLPADAVEV